MAMEPTGLLEVLFLIARTRHCSTMDHGCQGSAGSERYPVGAPFHLLQVMIMKLQCAAHPGY
jgi:hypothetical protein